MLARLFHQLAPFQPTLIGTFPLGLQVDGSALDIAGLVAAAPRPPPRHR